MKKILPIAILILALTACTNEGPNVSRSIKQSKSDKLFITSLQAHIQPSGLVQIKEAWIEKESYDSYDGLIRKREIKDNYQLCFTIVEDTLSGNSVMDPWRFTNEEIQSTGTHCYGPDCVQIVNFERVIPDPIRLFVVHTSSTPYENVYDTLGTVVFYKTRNIAP